MLSQQQNPCTNCKSAQSTAQLEGTPYHYFKLHPGPCSSVGMWRGADRHTDRQQWPLYISLRLCLTRNV